MVRPRSTSGISSGRSSAIRPGPKADPAMPWSDTAPAAASNAPAPCPSNPTTSPASTSPDPAVASQAGASILIAAGPAGDAMTVSAPLSTMVQPHACAASAARVALSGTLSAFGKSRPNSPSCGVSTMSARPRRCSAWRSPAKAVSPPPSMTTGRPDATAVSTRLRVSAVGGRPLPTRIAVMRESSSSVARSFAFSIGRTIKPGWSLR